jgi:hypothetical protein
MSEEIYSVNVAEKDMRPERNEFQKEIASYNYGPLNVSSNNVTYPIAIIFVSKINEELGRKQLSVQEDRKKELSLAAEALLTDYKENSELTIFTSIDSEDFRA